VRISVTLLAFALVMLLHPIGPATAENVAPANEPGSSRLVIGGTGSGLAIIRKLGAIYIKNRPGVTLFVPPSLGSGGGKKALAAGKLDLAVSAKPLDQREIEEGLVEFPFAETPLVFASRDMNGLVDVSLADIEKVYSSPLPTWPNGARLRIILRPQREADTQILKSLSARMAGNLKRIYGNRNIHVAPDDQDNAQAISEVPGSFGLISFGQLKSENRRLVILSFEGKTPSVEAVKNNEYPLTKTLWLLAPASPRPHAGRFLAFLRSAEAAVILKEHGFLPLELAYPLGK